jgi:hypothetical protein
MQNKNMKIKEWLIDDSVGVEAIALVEFPAIEVDFMLFSKNTSNICFAKLDNEKHIVTGPAMIPDKMIYRYDKKTNEEFYGFCTKATIEQISQKYLIESKQSNVNLEHTLPLSDISLVESWIVIDPDNDKATALGYKVPKGTWMISMKINNEAVWNDMVKSELVKGFSIEGYFVEKFAADNELQFNKETELTDDQQLQMIIDLLNTIED